MSLNDFFLIVGINGLVTVAGCLVYMAFDQE